MILAAGLLVLTGLGLFLAGVSTGTTGFYWACVAVCVGAAALLIAARRRISRAEAALPATTGAPGGSTTERVSTPAPSTPATAVWPAVPAEDGQPAGTTATGATATGATATGATATGETAAPSGFAARGPEYREVVPRDQVPTPASAGPGSSSKPAVAAADLHDPPIEDVEVTDLLLVVDLTDEVLVVDEHPRYHLEGCRFLVSRTAIPLPLDEARTDGFTPCALCTPDRHLADRERARKAGRGR
ncbi:MAG: uncharacterized protein JWQ45_1010 [Blastococcus sp.]|nr:uncharacterized protein [Blastococcus sp.]